ncbi:antibiotic biosynthesis monooxygenase [Kribbella sp. CA-294648]|uniref:antibiotic biosynthesis monooxygenase n=1 Tax=Kribbella sp. CA-294648 TaxID=3239948 RepID=UPI003D8EFE43
MRIWRTGLDERRAAEYETFAAERSLPMFKRQAGCLGVLFGRTASGRMVVTFWRDQEAAEALAESDDYLETVAAIMAAGFLEAPQSVELLPVDDAWVASELF